ncbi:DEAD/DEAH box helicase [Demequina subtropica]|uniref:DEAD/DEAH box helicase n=1 Tax=Demequina subtropica TaxID=1638989 RepID=UPI000B0FF88E|nr:DEAD/DEAH box helicase [Demequina subtropica]
MTETHASVQANDTTFADYNVDPRIVEALADKGIISPFPIQAMTLPVALSGHDIIGQAKTGTGKTLGFGIPALQRTAAPGEDAYELLGDAKGKPQALIVAPTRELAVQVANDLDAASRKRAVRIVQIYGGRAYEPQIEALQKGADVIVGTPGRMIDLLNQGHLDLRFIKTVVLDEADEMLDLGFLPDVEKLLAATPASRHTMLFSATMPGAVVALARRYMTQPTHIRAADPDDDGATVKAIKQVVYRAHALDKVEVLARLLQANGRGLTVVFARTKRTAAKVSDELRERGFAAGAIHGDLGQGAREQALRAFRSGKIDILVATDVAARGIDVTDVTHVVNYQCPEDEKTYLHRIGRTGRAGKTGTAVTFVDWDDVPRWSLIDKALDLGYPEPQETYSSSAHLFTDLDIPEGTKGRLPREKRTREGLEAETLEDLGETGKHTGGSGAGRSGGQGGRSGGRGQGGRGGSGSGSGEGSREGGSGRNRNRRRGGSGGSGSGEGSAPREPRAEGAAGSTPEGEAKPRRNRNRRRRRSGGSGSGEGSAPQAQPAGE